VRFGLDFYFGEPSTSSLPVLHNISYMLFLPIPGTASRYGALNHVVLWLALMSGLLVIAQRGRLWFWIAYGLISITTVNTAF